MKTRTLVSISTLIFAVLIIFGNCATKQIAISKEEAMEALVDTWINPEYPGDSIYDQKVIFTTEGKVSDYTEVTSRVHNWQGSYTIVESWKDRKGNIWYKLTAGNDPRFFKHLVKINVTENTLEHLTYGQATWPIEIDTKHINYRIYYRQ